MQSTQQLKPPKGLIRTLNPVAGLWGLINDAVNYFKFNNYESPKYNENQISNIAENYKAYSGTAALLDDIIVSDDFYTHLNGDDLDFMKQYMPETYKAVNNQRYDSDKAFKEYLDIKSSSIGKDWNSDYAKNEYAQYITGFGGDWGKFGYKTIDKYLLQPLSALESIGKMPFNLIKQGYNYLNGKQHDPKFAEKLGNFYKSLLTGEYVEGKSYMDWYNEIGFDDVLPDDWRENSKGVDILNYVLSELTDVSNYMTFGTGLVAKGATKGAKIAAKEATKLGGKEVAKLGSKEAVKVGSKEIAEKSGEEIGRKLLSKASMKQLGKDAGSAVIGGALAGATLAYDLNPWISLGAGFFANPAEDIVRSWYKKRKMNLQNSNLDNIKRSNYVKRNPSSVSYSTVKKPITQTATKKPIRNNNTTADFIQTNTEVPLVRFSGEDDLSAIDNLSKSPKEINSKAIEKPQKVPSQSIAETPLLPPDFLLPQDMPQNTSLPKDISLQQKITSQQNTKAYNDWLNQQMQDNQRNQQMLNAFDKYMNKGK